MGTCPALTAIGRRLPWDARPSALPGVQQELRPRRVRAEACSEQHGMGCGNRGSSFDFSLAGFLFFIFVNPHPTVFPH